MTPTNTKQLRVFPSVLRKCCRCKEAKTIDRFTKDPNQALGRSYVCKDCQSVMYKMRRQKNKEAMNERIRELYWTKNREKKLIRGREYQKSHPIRRVDPDKERTRRITQAALRKRIINRLPCEVCGEVKSETHHLDYNKPFEIMWLCKKHHAEWHRKNKAVDPIKTNTGAFI